MNIIKQGFLALLLACSVSSAFAQDGDSNNAGTVHFTGEIIDPSCVMQDVDVSLGTIPASFFSSGGVESALVDFSINLTGCPKPSEGLSRVQLTLNGPTVAGHGDLLSVSHISSTQSTAATGVGVAVSLANTPTTLLVFGQEGLVYIDLSPSGSVISADFVARYHAYSTPVTAGSADADMVVNILYR